MNRPQIRISNLTSFPTESARDYGSEGSDDDILINILDEKAKLAEEEFDKDFIHFQKNSARKPELELREKAKLQAKFNKLSAENFHKEAKLRELKQSLYRMAQLTERNHTDFDEQLKNSVQDLKAQCKVQESKAEDEHKQTKILKNMCSRTRLTAMIIYQRVRELERTHNKITKNFKQFLTADFVSSNTYALAKNHRATLKSSVNDMIHNFRNASKKLKKREVDIKAHISNSIQRVQVEEMKQKVMSKASLMEALENETQELKITKKELSKIGKKLDFYRRNTKILQGIATRQGISVDFTLRMQDSDSRILIEIFKDLQHEEKKLNIRYQDLAFESNRKRKELERIKMNLDEIKSTNPFSYSKKIDTTYNMLKNNDIIELSIKKQQDVQDIDALGFRVLASLINLLKRSSFLLHIILLQNTNNKTISPNRNLLAYLRAAREYLENIKTVQGFENNEAIHMNETDFSQIYLTELEAEPQSRCHSSNCFSSTKKFNRLKNILSAHFGDDRNFMTLFITFLEEDHVARSYLTTEILHSYLNQKSAEEVIKSFGSLLRIIHKDHVDKIGNVASLHKELLASTQRSFIEDLNIATNYYLTEKPEMLEKFRAEVDAYKSQEFLKDPRFISKLKKTHRSHSRESKIIFKPIDRFRKRKSARKPAESTTPNPPSSSTQPLIFQRRSMSNSASSFKASLLTKNVLQEVLALDQKMQFLNFQEKKISREVKKTLPLTARLPIRYSIHTGTKSPSSTRPDTSRGVLMRASSLDVTQRSSSELKKRKVNKIM